MKNRKVMMCVVQDKEAAKMATVQGYVKEVKSFLSDDSFQKFKKIMFHYRKVQCYTCYTNMLYTCYLHVIYMHATHVIIIVHATYSLVEPLYKGHRTLETVLYFRGCP